MWEYFCILTSSVISLNSARADLFCCSPKRLPHRTPVVSITLTVILILHLFLPCSAHLYQFPIRQFRNPVSVGGVYTWKSSNYADGHNIFRRDVLSPEDFKQMKNNLNGLSGDGYYIDIDIGTPPQKMQVLIDTGSANFAVATKPDPNLTQFFHQDNSSSFRTTGKEIYVPYTEGEWRGTLGRDIVSLPTAHNVSATINIACITKSKAFFIPDAKWQGILGLSYAELARPDSSYLPFWDSLLSENQDISNIFSVQLCGSSFVHTHEKPLMEGTLVVGGLMSSLYKGQLFYTPIYKQWYYEVVLTDILVAGLQLGMDCKEYNFDKTIVDSGTTNIRLPNKVFDVVVKAIDKHVQGHVLKQSFYSGNDVICYTDMSVPFVTFPIVSFFLLQSENSSFRLEITPQHYLRPVENIEGDEISPDQTCVKFGFSPSASGTVLGAVFMEAFYVVFDRNMSRIGFGQTTCPLPDPSNQILSITVSGPFFTNKNLNECAYKKPENIEKRFLVISYALAALSVVVLLPVLLIFISWAWRLAKRQRTSDQDISESQAVLSGS